MMTVSNSRPLDWWTVRMGMLASSVARTSRLRARAARLVSSARRSAGGRAGSSWRWKNWMKRSRLAWRRSRVLPCVGFAIVGEVAQAGFVENALAEVRRAVGVGVFAPGGEIFGDGQEGFAVAGDEILPVAGTGGELGTEAQEDLGSGEGVGKGAVGRTIPGG